MVVEGASPIQLKPNVVQAGKTVTVEGVTNCYVTIANVYGQIALPKTAVSGTFNAPNTQGTYFVEIQDNAGTYYRTLIVY